MSRYKINPETLYKKIENEKRVQRDIEKRASELQDQLGALRRRWEAKQDYLRQYNQHAAYNFGDVLA